MRYLMHSVRPLTKRYTVEDVKKRKDKHNIGSMVHQYSIANTIVKDGDTIDFLNMFSLENPKEKAQYVNNNYDCVIVSVGDIFRDDMLNKKKYRGLIDFIDNLNIKTIAIGIGVRRRYWQTIEEYTTGEMAYFITQFMKCILKNSNIVGVRGYDTAKVLEKIGFVENKDFYICGCPSMFINGGKLLLPLDYNKNDLQHINIAINRNFNITPPHSNKFFMDILQKYANSNFIFTWFYEVLNFVYETNEYNRKQSVGFSSLKNMRFKYSTDIHGYFELLSKYDLCIGERIHGCIAAISVGVPTFIVCVDNRMEEICNYHKLPHITTKNINKDTNFEDIVKKIDFSEAHAIHKQNYEKYLNFFKLNGVDIFFDEQNFEKNTPFKYNIEKN